MGVAIASRKMGWGDLVVCVGLCGAVSLALGCAPQTLYRRSALVPIPRGETFTTPVRQRMQLGGSYSHTLTHPQGARVGDPALHLAESQFEGFARARIGDYFVVGGQLYFSHYDLSSPSTVGTPPLLDEDLFGAGPNTSVHVRPRGWPVGFAASFATTLVRVPWATWARKDGLTSEESGATTGTFVRDEHDLAQSGGELHLFWRGSLGVDTYPVGPLMLLAGLSIENAASNIGFDDEERDGSTLSVDDVGCTPFLGAHVSVPGGAFVQVQYFVPLEFRSVGLGPFGGVDVTAGFELF